MAEQIRKAAARGKRISGNNLLLLITILLFVAMYAAGCVIYGAKGFTHFQTFLNLLITNAGLLCVTCGMTCVMLTGGIDISVGSLIAMDCMILADGMTNKHIGAIPLIIFVMVIGVVFGLVQGFLVSYMQIQPFIVTMAGMFFGRGMTAVINTQQVSITMDSSQTFYAWANAKINLPAFLGYMGRRKMIVPFIRPTVIIALLVCVVIALVLKYTKFGRVLYAVGGNESSAKMMGLNVKRAKLEAKKKDDQIADLTDRYKRTLAEYENFRKRTEKEKSDIYAYAVKDVLTKILPVADSFERGLAAVPDDEKDGAVAKGMEKIYKQFQKTLSDIGVKPIEAEGKPFDPNYHNAVMHVEDDSLGENVVAKDLQKGYTYKDTVIRHSMVQVAN